jgi:hypothetical protein
MLRKSVWARRRMGISVYNKKPRTAVKKRHMNTGTYVAIQPRRINRMIAWLDSINAAP